MNCKDVFLFSFALASTPIIFINSVVSLDYIWALSFIFISLYLLVNKKMILSGFFMGLAIGCRITSGAMLLPFMILIFRQMDRQHFTSAIVKFCSMSLGIGLLLFLPVIGKYGLSFFRFDEVGYPTIAEIIKMATIDVFGIIGTVSLLFILTFFTLQERDKSIDGSFSKEAERTMFSVSLVVCILYGLAFLRLPGEAGYLIPMIPFFLILLALRLKRAYAVVLCITLIASACFLSMDSIDRPWSPSPSKASICFKVKGREVFIDILSGPMVNSHKRRVEEMRYVDRIITYCDSLQPNSIIVTGSWLPQFAVTLKKQVDFISPKASFVNKGVEYVGLLDHDPGLNRQIFFLTGQDVYNKAVYGVDIRKLGGRELRTESRKM